MRIKILKKTPYRKGYEKEVKVGEVYDVISTEKNDITKSTSYWFEVEGRRRMVLSNECKIIE